MNSSLKSEVRRCRPLLGTFVEISATGADERTTERAIRAAFHAVGRIQSLLSAHDPASELSLLNRTAATRPVTVSGETFEVLRRGAGLARNSRGAFDFTVAPTLARWGLLPPNLKRTQPGNWRDVVLLPNRQVAFLRPLALDLGGIAKGFAVDRAIQALQQAGIMNATVNAGGDLRTLGAEPVTVHVRHPLRPEQLVHSLALTDGAIATSSPCFTQRRFRGEEVSHLVDTTTGRAITGGVSVSVQASECWMADALTKIVLSASDSGKALLSKFRAKAFVFAA